MKPSTTLQNVRPFKAIFYVALGLATYWLLDHWPDFKKGFLAGYTAQAKPKP